MSRVTYNKDLRRRSNKETLFCVLHTLSLQFLLWVRGCGDSDRGNASGEADGELKDQ